jgi:cardiolipin synthase
MLITIHILIQAGLITRILLRQHRDPTSRIAWIVVVLALPVVGIISYLLLGETNIGAKRAERLRGILAAMPKVSQTPGWDAPMLCADVPEFYRPLFNVGRSISGFEPVGGNLARLMADSDATIDAMVADIEAARDHVHVLFYIWLPDNNGTRVAEALKRAATRGVTCRALVDGLGSRALVRSHLWTEMASSGVKLARALPINHPLFRVFFGRIDLRNHRKIVVIDNWITYCGSQNCADPAFLPKAQYAPWVDAVMRFEGAVARQNQSVFASDWMTYYDEDIRDLLRQPIEAPTAGFPAQVIASGPTVRYSAMPEMFESLIYSARHELVITTPYYVPDDALQGALCAAGNRGVAVTIVFPARNDDFAVAAASRGCYADLLAAGVNIYEYVGGLLHAKSLTLDGQITLIGSANMDRRSFDLNYENNILLSDPALTFEMRRRQDVYIALSKPVTAAEVDAWSLWGRLRNNVLAMLGPVL